MTLAKILVVEDDQQLQEALAETLSLHGYEVETANSAEEALKALRGDIGMVFSDIRMDGMDGVTLLRRIRSHKPWLPVVLMTAYGSVDQAVEAMKLGAVDYLTKPFEANALVEKAERFFNRVAASEDDFIAADPTTQQIKAMARKVAQSDASVYISGESGTGKEVLARYIHANSPRKEAPFVAINCAAIPENMLEAVLFGYEKGAFTGAVKSMPGKFEQAQGGTLFLDEIGEMRPDLQTKLLRVLQEREVERLGSHEVIPLDVRILSASNIDIQAAIERGDFREDLFYRLNVFPIHLPPLRERKKDIPYLAEYLIQRHCGRKRVCPVLSAPAMKKLLEYDWPGNIRELDNVIQRALVLAESETIQPEDILLDSQKWLSELAGPASLMRDVDVVPASAVPAKSANVKMANELKAHETQVILDTLQRFDGHRQKTAEALGISPRTLRYKLAKLKEAGYDIP
ncbi:two-component system, response regulator FlrC [Sulfurivirga caldicuralii]|uniref:Two-component system, response regulator FlrC n=1 Tax=Sulfurivirga caldicuralii TaxID=364032 RepID=A0A1N6FMH2_9GAMM|nr:sigma-54 dependent transcriptional regulator [Sulfurivirga caldicuralii]SIN96426.1 two-component system, response regulator FlrC [Sulfurivirga caldicuralii]